MRSTDVPIRRGSSGHSVRVSELRWGQLPERQPLTDGMVTLREPVTEDVANFARSARDPDIVEFTHVPLDFGLGAAARLVAAVSTDWQAGVMARFAIARAEAPSRLLGSISLVHINWDAASAELGFWLLPEARGHGLAKRSVRLVTTWAFEVVGLNELCAEVFEGNGASWRVLMANGFRDAGRRVITHRGTQRGERLAVRHVDAQTHE